MSYFPDGVAYIIVPDDDISTEMVNNAKISFNSDYDTLRKTLPEVFPKRVLFKVVTPVCPVFDGYEWFNIATIKIEMAKVEWTEAEA